MKENAKIELHWKNSKFNFQKEKINTSTGLKKINYSFVYIYTVLNTKY